MFILFRYLLFVFFVVCFMYEFLLVLCIGGVSWVFASGRPHHCQAPEHWRFV